MIQVDKNLKKNKIMEYNIGDKVIDIKTNRIAFIAQKYQSKQNSNYYYFITFLNNTGCYRSQLFLKLF